MAVVLTFEENLVRVICGYGPQSGRTSSEKEELFDEMEDEWDLINRNELVICLGNFSSHEGEQMQGFKRIHGGN